MHPLLENLLSRSLTLRAVQESDLASLLAPDSASAVAVADPGLLGSMVRMLGALGVVLALLIVTLYVIKRLSNRSQLGAKPVGAGIEILQQRSLGGRRHLTVVRWEGRQLLLGVTNESITALAEELNIPTTNPEPTFTGRLADTLQSAGRR